MACAIGLIASSAPSGASADTSGFGVSPPGQPLLQWLPEEINAGAATTFTQDQAVAAASRYDVIVAYPQAFASYLGAMRAANPDLVVLAYMNGMFVPSTQGGTTWPADWYSYDANGVQVQNATNHNYLMNPSSSGWIQNRVTACQSALQQSGYDGCMLDTLGVAPLTAGYTTALPVNPATGLTWTRPDWLAATTQLSSTVRSAVSPSLVVGNGLKDGPSIAESSILFNGMDGGIAEAFLRSATQGSGTYPSEATWQQHVNMLKTAPKPILALTKVWSSPTADQLAQWHLFSLASFLLGTDGGDYFFFSSSSTEKPVSAIPWTVDIGDPSAGYAAKDGVYQRSFTNGLVLVNPTGSSVTVPLSGAYTRMDGSFVADSMVMGADTGEILTDAQAVAPGAPINVSATAGAGQATVSFSPPISTGGSQITRYTVTATDESDASRGGQTATTSGGTTTATVTGLTGGDRYHFTVTATNSAGTGADSAPSNTVVVQAPVTPPGPPLNVTATAGTGSATVSFDPPASDGGSNVTSYTVTAADSTVPAHGGQTASGGSSPITVKSLTAGESYTFTVVATNAAGDGPASDPSNSVVPVAPPSITVVTTTPSFAVAKSSYSYQLQASGGTSPYSWTQTGGALPPGLTLSTTGLISGTPTSAGTYAFSAQVSDSSTPAGSTTQSFTLTVYTKASNGSGTETISPSTATRSSRGNVFTLVYTAPQTGALWDGKLRIAVPSGWTAPKTSSTAPGRVTSTMGTVGTSSQVITISKLRLAPGATVVITYGDTSNGKAGVTVSSKTGVATFSTKEASTASASLVSIGQPPGVTIS